MTTFDEVTCCSCGIPFCINSEYNNNLKNSHKSFYCPNGHSQSYVAETEAEKFKKLWTNELLEKQKIKTNLNNCELEKENFKKSIIGYKGKIAQLNNSKSKSR